MRVWKITLEVTIDQGPTQGPIGPIDVNRGIWQGDSFCVQLFTMCLNPIAWYIRSTEGYSISKDKNRKVTHNLFVDDLKTYHKSLIEEMGRLFDMTQTEATRLLRKSQKWVHCQNCEIVKKFYTHDTC